MENVCKPARAFATVFCENLEFEDLNLRELVGFQGPYFALSTPACTMFCKEYSQVTRSSEEHMGLNLFVADVHLVHILCNSHAPCPS